MSSRPCVKNMSRGCVAWLPSSRRSKASRSASMCSSSRALTTPASSPSSATAQLSTLTRSIPNISSSQTWGATSAPRSHRLISRTKIRSDEVEVEKTELERDEALEEGNARHPGSLHYLPNSLHLPPHTPRQSLPFDSTGQ